MKLRDALIVWECAEHGGNVRVVPRGTAWGYTHSSGGGWNSVQALSRHDAMVYVMGEALHLIKDWGLDPVKVDRALNKINEYRAAKRQHWSVVPVLS